MAPPPDPEDVPAVPLTPAPDKFVTAAAISCGSITVVAVTSPAPVVDEELEADPPPPLPVDGNKP